MFEVLIQAEAASRQAPLVHVPSYKHGGFEIYSDVKAGYFTSDCSQGLLNIRFSGNENQNITV